MKNLRYKFCEEFVFEYQLEQTEFGMNDHSSKKPILQEGKMVNRRLLFYNLE